MRRIPLNAVGRAMYSLLSTHQKTPVYDNVPEGTKYPYITIGAINVKDTSTKWESVMRVSVTIHIWTTYKGHREVNRIADAIVQAINEHGITLDEDFQSFNCAVDFFESYLDDEGYNGALTIILDVQDMED